MASLRFLFLLPLVCLAQNSTDSISSISSATSNATESSSTVSTTTAFPYPCEDKADGNYADPRQNCSHIFFACVNGQSIQQHCPGGTYYDQLINRCQYKKWIAACGGVEENITITQPTPQPTPLVPDIKFDCMEEIGNFPNPMAKCSALFFICAPGYQNGFPFHCAPTTFYDWEMNKCLYHYMVPECTGENRTEMLNTTSEHFDCTDKQGNFAPESVICPEYFYQCSVRPSIRQRLTRVYCPSGLAYDPTTDSCLSHADVPGCSHLAAVGVKNDNITEVVVLNATVMADAIIITVNHTVVNESGMATNESITVSRLHWNSTAVENTTAVENSTAAVNSTEGLMPTDFIPVENNHTDTSENVTTTLKGIPDQLATESSNISQSANHSAVDNVTVATGPGLEGEAVNTTGTNASSTATGYIVDSNVTQANDTHLSGDIVEVSTVSPSGSGVTQLPNGTKPRFGACKDRINGFYANPDNCATYYFCADSAEYQIQCQSGTVFNARRNQCDSPSRVYQPCGKREIPKEFSCGGKAGGRYGDPLDCNHYYSCTAGKPEQHKCDGGLSFNSVTLQCDLPQNIAGCSPKSASDLAAFCVSKGKDDIYAIANPNNYVLCVQGTAFVGICPPVRSIFDVRVKSCVAASA